MGAGQGRPVGATQQGRQSYMQPAPQGFSPVGFAGAQGVATPMPSATPMAQVQPPYVQPAPQGFSPVGFAGAQVQPPYVQPAPQGFSPVGFAGAQGVATPMPSATPMAPRVPPGLPGTFTPQPSNPMAQPQQVRPEDQRMQAMRFLQQFKGFR